MELGAQWCNRLGFIFPSEAGLILPGTSARASCKLDRLST